MIKRTNSPGTPYLILAIILLTAFMLAGLSLANKDIIRKGQFLEYTTDTIYEVRFFDAFTLYLSYEHRPNADFANAFLLTGMAFICLSYSILFSFVLNARRSKPFWFFFLLFPILSYLAADEVLGIHECLGHNMQFFRELPFVERPDDILLLLYALPACVFLFYYREILLSSRKVLVCFLASFLAFLLASVLDFLDIKVEEIAELVSTAILAVGIIILGLEQIKARINPGFTPSDSM